MNFLFPGIGKRHVLQLILNRLPILPLYEELYFVGSSILVLNCSSFAFLDTSTNLAPLRRRCQFRWRSWLSGTAAEYSVGHPCLQYTQSWFQNLLAYREACVSFEHIVFSAPPYVAMKPKSNTAGDSCVSGWSRKRSEFNIGTNTTGVSVCMFRRLGQLAGYHPWWLFSTSDPTQVSTPFFCVENVQVWVLAYLSFPFLLALIVVVVSASGGFIFWVRYD